MQVSHCALVLLTKDFHPEKYRTLCQILLKILCKTGSPASMLESYLSVATKGTCNGEENGKFFVKDYDARQALATVHLKGQNHRKLFLFSSDYQYHLFPLVAQLIQ